jgi:hypothetical protein
MKTYITILLLVVISIANAQDLPVLSTTSLANPEDDMNNAKNGNYAKDLGNERDQYVGLWEYNQNGILFQIKIEKQDKVLNKREYNGVIDHYEFCDEVILRYKLVKNGVLIYNSLTQANVDPITSYGIKQAGYDYLDGRILDYTRNIVAPYTIVKAFSYPQKIIFKLGESTFSKLNPDSFYQDGQPLFTLPREQIELLKIN